MMCGVVFGFGGWCVVCGPLVCGVWWWCSVFGGGMHGVVCGVCCMWRGGVCNGVWCVVFGGGGWCTRVMISANLHNAE